MAKAITTNHLNGLIQYLSNPSEKANEDRALTYFRSQFPNFTRQSEAKGADGYVAGHFVLELKSKMNDWYAGLIQGLAYKRELDFSVIVVMTKGILAIWRIEDIPEELQHAVLMKDGAPNKIGKQIALDYRSLKSKIYKNAIWKDDSLDNLDSKILLSKMDAFDKTLKKCQKIRLKITPGNFTKILKQMVEYFDPSKPIMAVRAFYSMIYGWDINSILNLSNRDPAQATLNGESIKCLVPDRRVKFKNFVEGYYVHLSEREHTDDFFAQYDKALDTVDKKFRIQHGIFFTDLDLSKFAMWFVKKYIPDLGKDYIVVDPACGSGNLVTNWKAPLQLRHKIVSEIEPELLFAVEKRMKDPRLNDEKFTVVPKTSKGIGLNFLDRSAEDYINILNDELKEKGLKFNKPLAFLCNPPYRGDDDKSAGKPGYEVHPSIIKIIGEEAKAERYSCFLAQMKLICDHAVDSGLPADSRLLLFTKSAWLSNRSSFDLLRKAMYSSFGFIDGMLVNGREFFDVQGKFPVAFTIWRYKGDSSRQIENNKILLRDLTWIRKSQLKNIIWDDPDKLERECKSLIENALSLKISLDTKRDLIKDWIEETQKNFKRSRRKDEVNDHRAGGLPKNDRRLFNKCVYGENNGSSIGFMDDLTPCRIFSKKINTPSFRLNPQFMDVNRNRCFSGSSTHFGYFAIDLNTAKKTFLWFALGRTFAQVGYPLWSDALELWTPKIPDSSSSKVVKYAFSIGAAENECVETMFPANNPVKGAPEIHCRNPMAPSDPNSFWSSVMASHFSKNEESLPDRLVQAINALYKEWAKKFKGNPEIYVSYKKPYFIGHGVLKITAGLVQIKDYAKENNDQVLIDLYTKIQQLLKETKQEFYNLLIDPNGINYFGAPSETRSNVKPPQIKEIMYDDEKKIILASLVVNSLSSSKGFGRIKFAKVFYIADMMAKQDLGTQYYREAAGPIDYSFLYDKRDRVELLAAQKGYFFSKAVGSKIRYKLGNNISVVEKKAASIFKEELPRLKKIIEVFKKLSTEQSEIVATLFACWNDLLIDKAKITNQSIINELKNNWHLSKKRFTDRRLNSALSWMKKNSIIPTGRKSHTLPKRKLS